MKKLLPLLVLFTTLITEGYSQSNVDATIHAGGILRRYRIYIPKGYVKGSSMPLIIHLHGYTSTGPLDEAYTQYTAVADTAGFMVAYPNGMKLSGIGNQYWNAGLPQFPDTVNDVQFISTLIDTLHELYNIDLNRVYASGLSNGAFMAYSLAGWLSDRIVAIASNSGSMYPPVYDTCHPKRAVPVMEIHGTDDGQVPYNGSTGQFTTPVNTDTLMRFWAKNNGCNLIPVVTALPNTNTADGTTTTQYVFTGGNNNSTCVLYKINNGQHGDWPGSTESTTQDWNASITIWEFFKQYQLNQFTGIKDVQGNNAVSINFIPNPTTGSTTVSLPAEWNGHTIQVQIYNLVDQVVKSYSAVLNSSLSFNIAEIASGYYIVHFSDGQKEYVGKLVKE